MRMKLMVLGFIFLGVGLGLIWMGIVERLVMMGAGLILIMLAWVPEVVKRIKEKIQEIVIWLKARK